MLRLLRIRNLAVIEAVEVEFQSGFNVLTGETGAGKSILVEAVGLLLGGRASADLVRSGESAAHIEALFEDGRGEELIVRREIASSGRSRTSVNGTPATSAVLRELSQRFVELHGQHEHQTLLDPSSHLPLIDQLAALDPLRERVAAAWQARRALQERCDRAHMDARERAVRLDLLAFQLGEIQATAPRLGEDDELTTAKHVLVHAERIQRLCEESYAALYEDDRAVLTTLGGIWRRVGELATLDAQFTPYAEARDGIKSALEDLAFQLRRYADGVDPSPARLQQVEDRLALLERVKRKYGPTLQDVIDRGRAMARERDLLTGASLDEADLRAQLDEATAAYLTAARALSRERRAVAPQLARRLETLLGELAMAHARVDIQFNAEDLQESSWNERGIDEAELFLSSNPGEALRPLARIVSGGELSRIMLAVKALGLHTPVRGTTRPLDDRQWAQGVAAGEVPAKTLIFDEVDAGIGGRVAGVVGEKLHQLGGPFQVLCITHLPQIAARADAQFRIEKTVRGSRTVTSVSHLDEAGRVEELARMIGGDSVTPSVRASARELLGRSAVPARTAARSGSDGSVRSPALDAPEVMEPTAGRKTK
jgi:DNA repair protein RecN (Recombination protein N)